MRRQRSGKTAMLLAGLNAWALESLFRGFSASSLPLLVLLVLVGMLWSSELFPLVFMLFVLGLFSPASVPWAVLVAGVSASVAGGDTKVRVTGFLAVFATLWFSPVPGSLPLVVVAVAGVLVGGFRYRYLLIPVAFLAAVFLRSLPGPASSLPVIARSVISEETIRYDVPELNTSRTEVVLPAPVEGTWALWLAIECGGVRDSLPVYAVALGENFLLLPAGTDTLSFCVSPGDSLTITLMRKPQPFYHTVVHAFAGGERLL